MRWRSIAALSLAMLAFPVAGLPQVRILGFWWENPMPYQAAPKGLTSITAAQCGVCHQEIYQEWQVSNHAQALSDRQLQAEMTKSPPARWLCLNCHTPLENQLETIAVGVKNNSARQPILQKNPRFDATLAAEGVTCAVCHVQDGVVLGPYGDSRAPHPVRRDPTLSTEQRCAACHQATAAYTDTLVCSFDTAGEWRDSPYAARGQPCAHCHMPEVERPVALGGPVRASRRHLFIGSKIPKERDLPPAHRKFYDLFEPGLSVGMEPGAAGVKLRLQNARAGHMLPTGDPERYILVKASLLDSAGGVIDSQTYRIGQIWVWEPEARKVFDNSLRPLEARTIEMRFQTFRRKAARVRVVVENWRINDQNADYHKLGDEYPRFAEVLRAEKPVP